MLVAVQPQQARIVLVIHLHDEADHRAIVAVELSRELATNIIGPYGVLDRADIEDAGELAEMIGHDTAPHCKDRLGGGYISAHHDASRRRSRDASSSASDSRPGSESRTMIVSTEHTVPATRAIVAAAGCCLSSSDLSLTTQSTGRFATAGQGRSRQSRAATQARPLAATEAPAAAFPSSCFRFSVFWSRPCAIPVRTATAVRGLRWFPGRQGTDADRLRRGARGRPRPWHRAVSAADQNQRMDTGPRKEHSVGLHSLRAKSFRSSAHAPAARRYPRQALMSAAFRPAAVHAAEAARFFHQAGLTALRTERPNMGRTRLAGFLRFWQRLVRGREEAGRDHVPLDHLADGGDK